MISGGANILSQSQLRAKVRHMLTQSTDPVERIRLTALLRGPGGIRDIGRIFRNMDDDNSGQISFSEFQQGVTAIGCVLDHCEMQKAYDQIDSDHSGSISYEEFLENLRDKIMNSIRERMVQEAFKKLDKDGSGCLTIEDLRGVCDVSGHPKILSGDWTEEQALEQFLSNFDTPDNFDATITKDEFFSYYAGVSASINKDEDFLMMVNDTYHLFTTKPNTGIRKVKTALGLQRTAKEKVMDKCKKALQQSIIQEAAEHKMSVAQYKKITLQHGNAKG
ncbi:calcyphosin-like protein isoform X2 [Symsagittifera roscoffensis]